MGEEWGMGSRYRLKECELATQQKIWRHKDVITTSSRRDVPAGYLLLLSPPAHVV